MKSLTRISVALALLAVIAMGSLAVASNKPPDVNCAPNVKCLDVYDPVICADGAIYANLCYARVACAPMPCEPWTGDPI